MARIKHLTDKVAQLEERDHERRSILGWIATLLDKPKLREKKKAAREIERHAKRLAW